MPSWHSGTHLGSHTGQNPGLLQPNQQLERYFPVLIQGTGE